jgi:excisionase family DNA binding protein
MEALSVDLKKELSGSAAEILRRINKVGVQLGNLKADIERNFNDVFQTDPLLTKREACQILKISITTLDKLIADGSIKSIKVGEKSVRIPQSELQSFISK